MTINLHSMALAMPRVGFNLNGSAGKTCSALVPGPCATAHAWNSPHPNRLPFRGVLTLIDSPSDRPPVGARSHRVILTRAAAEQAIPSLLGMGLDFTASFDGHDTRRKVGIITSAEIVPLANRVEQAFRPALSAARKLALAAEVRAQRAVEAVGFSPLKNESKNVALASARVEQAFRPALGAATKGALAPEVRAQRAVEAVGFSPLDQRNRHRALPPESLKGHGFSRAVKTAKGNGALAPGAFALQVHGFIFARDFPDVVRELRAHKSALGMSYEITSVRVADPAEKIWRLTEATFTGAAVLRRDKAAYSQTSIELIEDQSPHYSLLTTPNSPKEQPMNEELTQQFLSTASRLAAAAESLESVLSRIDSTNDAVCTKIDRIIAAVDSDVASPRITQLEARIAELERTNTDLKAQAARSARKTLPPLVTALLAKNGLDSHERIDPAILDKTLAPLSVEQRIAVKAQMARAGIID
jgi:hypothetical protein